MTITGGMDQYGTLLSMILCAMNAFKIWRKTCMKLFIEIMGDVRLHDEEFVSLLLENKTSKKIVVYDKFHNV